MTDTRYGRAGARRLIASADTNLPPFLLPFPFVAPSLLQINFSVGNLPSCLCAHPHLFVASSLRRFVASTGPSVSTMLPNPLVSSAFLAVPRQTC